MIATDGTYRFDDPQFQGAPTRRTKEVRFWEEYERLSKECLNNCSLTLAGWKHHFGLDYEAIQELVLVGKLERKDVFGQEAYRPVGGWDFK